MHVHQNHVKKNKTKKTKTYKDDFMNERKNS